MYDIDLQVFLLDKKEVQANMAVRHPVVFGLVGQKSLF